MQRNYGSNRAATLQDLLNYSDAQPQSSVAVPVPPDASRVDGGGGFDPQERQRLIDMLLTPDNVGDAPQVDKPNAMSLLFTGLGDALSAHVAGNTGNPGMRTNAMDQYLRNIEMQKAEKRAYDERRGAAANRAKDRTANYLLSEMDRKQELATAAAAKKEMLAYQAQQKKDAIAQHAQDLADAEARDNRAAVRDAKIRSEFAKEREIHDAAQERLHEKQRQGDKIALRDEAKIDAVKEYIGTLADNLDEILKVKDPVAVMNSARRFMDRQSMSKDAREIVESYMRQEVTSRIVEQNDLALDAGSPQQQDPNAPMTPWQRNPSEAAGAVVGRVAQPFIDSAKGIGQTPAGSAIKRVWNRGIGN